MSTDYSEPAQDRAIDMSAAEFIERRDSKGWNERDEAELDEWLAQSTAHRVAFLRLNASWKRTERLVALRTPLPAIRPANDRSGNGLRLKYAAAAAASLLLLGGLATVYLSTPRYDTFSTPVGGREILTLRDGSRIELNTDTRIRVSRNSQERSIQLERGEVYFQVRHNAARPFVVTAQGHRLTDLGTQFSARIEGSALKVALLEGSVKFEADEARGNKPAILSPGDVLMASTDAVSVKKEPLRDLMASLAWRQGMLVFHETTLADAAREFNRYNQTKIVIRDPQAGRETINGMLPSNNLDEFARMAKNLFGLHVERQENEILLTR